MCPLATWAMLGTSGPLVKGLSVDAYTNVNLVVKTKTFIKIKVIIKFRYIPGTWWAPAPRSHHRRQMKPPRIPYPPNKFYNLVNCKNILMRYDTSSH